jgi:BTB/POZ domain
MYIPSFFFFHSRVIKFCLFECEWRTWTAHDRRGLGDKIIRDFLCFYFSFAVILKDVTFSIMTELLQFMYQGEVNVKHTELQTFMKIAESLQIKGLTTSQKTVNSPPHAPHEGAVNFVGTPTSATNNNNSSHHNNNNNIAIGHHHRHEAMGPHEASGGKPNNHVPDDKPPNYPPPIGSAAAPPSTSRSETASQPQASSSGGASKRAHDYSSNPESYGVPYMRKQSKRSAAEQLNDHEISADSIDQMATDEVFLPPIPHISMTPGGEPRFDLTAVKRENIDMPNSPNSFARAHSLATSLGFDYSTAGNSSNSNAAIKPTVEYPNDLHSTNDFSKGMPPHMDIPPGKTADVYIFVVYLVVWSFACMACWNYIYHLVVFVTCARCFLKSMIALILFL